MGFTQPASKTFSSRMRSKNHYQVLGLNTLQKVLTFLLTIQNSVQQQCLPSSLLGVDVLCQAKAGMGKTAVFVISVLQNLKDDAEESSCLVLTLTRELAIQISGEFERFLKNLPNIRCQGIWGGVSIERQIDDLKEKKSQVIVGTPGRVLTLVKRGKIHLQNNKIFVLDECDKMLGTLGKNKINELQTNFFRHEKRHSKHFQRNPS